MLASRGFTFTDVMPFGTMASMYPPAKSLWTPLTRWTVDPRDHCKGGSAGFSTSPKPESRKVRKSDMGRSLNQIVEELPPERRDRVEARYQALKQEVEGLRQLRQIAGKAQLDIATALNIKQPSVSCLPSRRVRPAQ